MTDLVQPHSLASDLARWRPQAGDEGLLDPVGLRAYLHETCDRIDECDPRVHAFVPEPGRRARLVATAVTSGLQADLPLAGVPVGIKDIVRVAGLEIRAGSALPPAVFAGPQAVVVDRLLGAGALVAGLTVTAEFAVSAPGATTNPHNPGHTPGGSSSGSAAAVAAGMVPLAIGTQTIGSVIRPAAYCGVVGYRATWGRIPTDGVVPNAPSLDALGCFAADVASVEVAVAVLCDDWRESRPTRRPVLGVPRGAFLAKAAPGALAAFEVLVALLVGAGFDVRAVPTLDDIDEVSEHLYVVNRYELAEVHADWYAGYQSLYREQTAQTIEQGRALTPQDYREATRYQRRFRDRLLQTMVDHGIDLWLSPSATGPAPEGLASTGDPIMCVPYSFAGLPAVSLPTVQDPAGLPLGLQLAGRAGADEELLAWAGLIAAALVAT